MSVPEVKYLIQKHRDLLIKRIADQQAKDMDAVEKQETSEKKQESIEKKQETNEKKQENIDKASDALEEN